MTSREHDIAIEVFRRLQTSFPNLTMSLDEAPEEVDLTLEIPAQEGLLFNVGLNLQNVDELHLMAESFWGSWFPCTDPQRADDFVEAVSGLLSGNYRLLNHWRGGTLVRSQLQRLLGDKWKTVYNSVPFFSLPWPRKTFKVVQNDPQAGPAPAVRRASPDAEELPRIRAEIKRLISRRNRFVALAYGAAAVVLIACAIAFDPLQGWALIPFAIVPALLGELAWFLSTSHRPRCPVCGLDWTHEAFLKWDTCQGCDLSLTPEQSG